MKDLGNRMKRYELISQFKLTPRTPVIICLDGKAFHTLTKNMNKPFDYEFIKAMKAAAIEVAKEIQGFKLAYVQSDEASFLLTDYDTLMTEGWFQYRLDKILSISASIMSVYFSRRLDEIAYFDARAFNIPEDDIPNYFLWRTKDWARNSLNMYAQSFFSHKQLMNKCSSEVHEMLHDIGKNWATDLPNIAKNGTWILDNKITSNANYSTYDEIKNILVI